MRKTEFANDEYYHIYNRGVDKREVFCCEKDFARFIKGMREFNKTAVKAKPPVGGLALIAAVEIICYCLNLNHYHFILKQLTENGIAKFMQKLGTSYTMYFNIKYDRSGSLFQGPFQAKHIDTNGYLLWLSGYVNSNVEIHKIAKAENYKWCSCQDYLGKRNGTLCNKKIILSQFKNIEKYREYVKMIIKESNKRKDLEEYFIEEI